MPDLKEHPTLKDIQQYVSEFEIERGFDKNPNVQTAFQMVEEMGELFKAIRKEEKLRIDHNSDVGGLDEELADILVYLAALANRYGVDLEQAFRDKGEINKAREWKPHE
jgi:NTP pyrophosphatase (non-canonical NTP hydrolase)